MNFRFFPASLILFGLVATAQGDDPASRGARSVPATRTELKQILEDSKHAEPRLPLPPTSAEPRTREPRAEGRPQGLRGEGTVVNNGLMRRYYLPSEWSSGAFSRGEEPNMTLGYPFQTRLFWIVSRANNCIYCMGHQESKLSAVGLNDDEIAALDGDWSEFSDADRAAFTFTRKLTFEPHNVDDEDIEALRAHYNDHQILEILVSVCGFNAMNRWTSALNIPQEEHREYLTPTSSRFADLVSQVAPLDPQRSEGEMACAVPARRQGLESREHVEAILAACRDRTPRLPLVAEDEARSYLPKDWPEGTLPHWVRLLATFPEVGIAKAQAHRATEGPTIGRLDPQLRAEIAWVAARHDRAWYALDNARQRLATLGLSLEEIFALDEPCEDRPEAEQLVLDFARKLTVDPALIDDEDIVNLRRHFDDHQVAEIVFQVTEASYFNRLTEAAGLPLD